MSVEALAPGSRGRGRFSAEAATLAHIISHQLKKQPTRVLVVGCGKGHHAAQLALSLDANVTGVERRRSFDPAAEAYASLHAGDPSSLRFGDGAFDFVYSHQDFEHVASLRSALGEMRRVLARGGGFCLKLPSRRGFTVHELRSELIAAFGEAFDVTQHYYAQKRDGFSRIANAWWGSGLVSSLVPSRYFMGRRTDARR